MCGFAGFLDRDARLRPTEWKATLERMGSAVRHRGPDDSGTWMDPSAGIALTFRRLSILDLSPLGHQPMESVSGRYVLMFNGEVYNFAELRAELTALGHGFRGQSDTEVMLAAVTQWGVRPAIERFNGMFAIVLWDREDRVLYFARDRAGKKPLYYGTCNGVFLYGSELKALLAHPLFEPRIDHGAIALYLRYAYVPGPYSVYEGIRKLRPGTILRVDGRTEPEEIEYWSLRDVAERGVRNPFRGTETEAIREVEALLTDAVAKRMIADVPLGAFLSGGIDSSLIVSLMQASSSRPVRTFSIGFHEQAYDEAKHAKAVAAHLGTDHTELYASPQEVLDVVPLLPKIYDEPFGDSSGIPTYLVSKLAREHVTVALTGDAGDESFGGYNRHVWGHERWGSIARIPRSLRRLAARGLELLSPDAWERLGSSGILPKRLRVRTLGVKAHKVARTLALGSGDDMYIDLVTYWRDAGKLARGATEPPVLLTDRSRWARVDGLAERMMFLDMATYLPDEILVKVDRATMRASLEGRAPFLDYRLIELAWTLPVSMKIRDGRGKWLLRQLLYKYVPEALVERPKMGFAVPVDEWLRGPLRGWAEALLDERRLREEGLLDPIMVRSAWNEHLRGAKPCQDQLWNVLMLQAWLDEYRGARQSALTAEAPLLEFRPS